MRTYITLFLITFSVIHSTHTMDNPPQHELANNLYKQIKKELLSTSTIKKLKKLIPNKNSCHNLSLEQKNRLLNKSRQYLHFLKNKKRSSMSTGDHCVLNSTVGFIIFLVSCVTLMTYCFPGYQYIIQSQSQYDSKIRSCENKCDSYFNREIRYSGYEISYPIYNMDCKRSRPTKWLTPDAYELWEHLGFPEKNNYTYHDNKCWKIINFMYSLCKNTQNCSAQIQPPAPVCELSFYCNKADYIVFFNLLLPIIGSVFLCTFLCYGIKKCSIKKGDLVKIKINYLEKIFFSDKCCICYEKKALNGNIPCNSAHPNEGICNSCLKEIDECPFCRKPLLAI